MISHSHSRLLNDSGSFVASPSTQQLEIAVILLGCGNSAYSSSSSSAETLPNNLFGHEVLEKKSGRVLKPCRYYKRYRAHLLCLEFSSSVFGMSSGAMTQADDPVAQWHLFPKLGILLALLLDFLLKTTRTKAS